jgi:phosphonate transport system substrate-binding protein
MSQRGVQARPIPVGSAEVCMSSSLFARVGGLILLALLLTIAPGRATEPSEPAPAGPYADMVLRLGRVPFAGPGEVVRKIGWMQEYLKKAVGVAEVRLVFSRDRNYESLMTKVGSGEIDIAWLSTVAYLRGRERYRLQPLVRPIRGNATSYRGIIIVRKDSGVKTLADLRGKRIAWVDPESSSGYIFPRALLLQAGLDPARDLREERFLQKHDAVVWNVFLGKVDAGACFDDARKLLGNPLMIERLDVIGRTEPIPNEPIVCRNDLPAP